MKTTATICLVMIACILFTGEPAVAATTVATGRDHTLAVTVGGEVWAWGGNAHSQLGSGPPSMPSGPNRVNGLSGIAAVAAGDHFSVALGADGSVWTWGANASGQLGDGTTIDQALPTPVNGIPGVIAVSATARHVLVLAEDGTVWTWGDGNPVPLRVAGLPPIRRIFAVPTGSLALTAEGSVWSWSEDETSPAPIVGLESVSDLATVPGGELVAVSQGVVMTGFPSEDADQPEATELKLSVAVRSVVIVGHLAIALAADGTVWTWSRESTVETTSSRSPQAAPDLKNIVAVAGGPKGALALERGGALWAWSVDASAIEKVPIPDIMWQVDAPEFRPPEGGYPWPRYVFAGSNTPGAEIHITRDGSIPTLEDPILNPDDAVRIERPTAISARAWADHLDPSVVTVAKYRIEPIRSDDGHVVPSNQTRRRDGSAKAGDDVIFTEDFETGELSRWSSFQPPPTIALGAPILTPNGGVFAVAQEVSVTCPIPGAVVRYSLTGLPTETDPVVACGSTVSVARSTTFRARAWAVGFLPSATTEATYLFQFGAAEIPTFDPPGGSYGSAQNVTIATTTPGASIRYTLDGTQPNATSSIYAAPIEITTTGVLTARAFRHDHAPSGTAQATYFIGDATGRPVLGPGGGVYPSGLLVTVSNTTAGATIRYTTDGTDPQIGDTVIADGGTISVTRSLRIAARAWADGMDPSPVTIADYEIVGGVSAGAVHSMALRYDGTVWAWGENQSGEIGTGDDTVNEYRLPQLVVNLTDIIAVEAGSKHSMALRADGTVWAWGWGFKNRIGDGAHADRFAPVQVITEGGVLENIIALSGGYGHSLAIAADGTVWAWGDNYRGQLGIGTGDSTKSKAIQVPGLTGITAVAAGGEHSLVLKTDGEATGSLWAFGENANGEVGDGTTTERRTPVKVLDGVRSICAGGSHSMVVMADGSVLGTGLNDRGQLGNGTTEGPVLTFQPVFDGAEGIVGCSASGVHTLALTSGRRILGTGHNDLGQVGDGTKEHRQLPVHVVLIEDVAQVVAGLRLGSVFTGWYAHSIAATRDGRVWCWGSNNRGQLGNGWGLNDARFRPDVVRNFNLMDRSWPDGDPDGDGLTNERELELGTDPFNADSNGDGIDDLTASRSGLDPLDPDMDADGVDNSTERTRGTDPLRADSDDDGVNDAADCFPLDPSRSDCPEPVPGDTEPPVITLTEPTNAVLISSTP